LKAACKNEMCGVCLLGLQRSTSATTSVFSTVLVNPLHLLRAGIDTLHDVGCFGLTELGYGNNAVEMETTAIYDKVMKYSQVKLSHS